MTKEIIGVVAGINHLSSLFLSLSFVFIPRSENREADALAKLTRRLQFPVMNPLLG